MGVRRGGSGAGHGAVERAADSGHPGPGDAAGLWQHGDPKGAELSPATQGLIIDALDAAGFPPGVVNYLTCAPEDAPALVESLIAHPAVRRVNFTGSTPVGRIIARTCGQYLKPAVLEARWKSAPAGAGRC